MSVVWTPTAEADLLAAQALTAARSPRAAAAFAGRVTRRLALVDTLPYLGAAVDPADPAVREVYEPPYRILYEVAGADVVVLALEHARRQP